MVRIELRTVTLTVPPQEVITRDNVPVRVNAVAYLRVIDPIAAVVEVEKYLFATSQIAQTTLRSMLGQHELDELLSEREKINAILQRIIDDQTGPGASRSRRSRSRTSSSRPDAARDGAPGGGGAGAAREGDRRPGRVAGVREAGGRGPGAGRAPVSVQLRYLQTMVEMAAEHNSTMIFPIPIDLIAASRRIGGGA